MQRVSRTVRSVKCKNSKTMGGYPVDMHKLLTGACCTKPNGGYKRASHAKAGVVS